MARNRGGASRGPYFIVIVLALIGAFTMNRTNLDLSGIRHGITSVLRSPDRGTALPVSGPPILRNGNDVVTIASWTVRGLAEGAYDRQTLTRIADVIQHFDIVAIQDARDLRVLDRLNALLPHWTYRASAPVGRSGRTQIYAFFWNENRVRIIGEPATISDPHDALMYEPFAGTFRSGEFDFTLCTIQLPHDGTEYERRSELALMNEVVETVQNATGHEQDVILLGYFGFPPDDPGWKIPHWSALIEKSSRASVDEAGTHANIWINDYFTTEYLGEAGVVDFDAERFFAETRGTAAEKRYHRPVWARFDTSEDDDLNEYGDLSRAVLRFRSIP